MPIALATRYAHARPGGSRLRLTVSAMHVGSNSLCDRAYRRDCLMARFGADIALPDLLLALASYDRRQDFSRPCGARFTDLAQSKS